MYRCLVIIFLFCIFCYDASSQGFNKNYKFLHSSSILQDKDFYLFTILQQVPDLKQAMESDEACKIFRSQRVSAIASSIEKVADSVSFLSAYQFSAEDIEHARQVAGRLWSANKSFRSLPSRHLRPCGNFALYEPLTDSMMLMQSFSEAMTAVNSIINVYGMGRKGMNAGIDSVSYDIRSNYYKSVLVANAKIAFASIDTMNLFFEPTLNMAISLLNLNSRDEAARFEPLAVNENSQAFRKVALIKWPEYKYSAILVPGFGPEDNHSLDPIAKLRLSLAVDRYRKKMAPFIIVSGGYVHPFQTLYCEALEMKKELMKVYAIPESAIIIEPHARHTTTNIRNANRLILRYGLLANKPVLLTTTADQSLYIQAENFKKRCLTDMGHVPFDSLKRISVYDLEYLPVEASLHMKPSDPLDP